MHRLRKWGITPWVLLTPILTFLLLFYLAPFLWIVEVSLLPNPLRFPGKTMGFMNYTRLLFDAYYLRIMLQTFLLGFGITVFTLLLGYPCAYFIARTRSRWKPFFVFMVITPLMVSIIIRSYGWMVLLGDAGLLNTLLLALGVTHQPVKLIYNWIGVGIALIHVLLPFMILTVTSVLEGIDTSVEEAARVLGASRWQTFLRVTFPLSMEGVGAGCTLVFMLTIGSFVTILLVGGTETMVLPLLIYQQITVAFDNNFAAAIGTLLLLISVGILYLQARLFRVRGKTIR
ncbi:MAG: ABC transporter permease [Nitrospinota bacterium]|nr:MAG: ABC transporter permease [Nitrospinota bacterium]